MDCLDARQIHEADPSNRAVRHRECGLREGLNPLVTRAPIGDAFSAFEARRQRRMMLPAHGISI